jgi:hypothetical protein
VKRIQWTNLPSDIVSNFDCLAFKICKPVAKVGIANGKNNWNIRSSSSRFRRQVIEVKE